MSNAEESIKDNNDFLYDKEGEIVYAVPRFNTKNMRLLQSLPLLFLKENLIKFLNLFNFLEI